jgi:hypothetical protein
MISIIRLVICILLYLLTSFFITDSIPKLIVYALLVSVYFFIESYLIKPSQKELNLLTDMKKHGFLVGLIKSHPIHIILLVVFAYLLFK